MQVAATTIRLADDARRRIIKLVGEKRMSAFIRQAIDEKLDRDENATSGANPAAPAAGPDMGAGDWLWLVGAGDDQADG